MSRTRVTAAMAFVLAGGNLFQQQALADETEEALAKQLLSLSSASFQ